MAPAVCRKRIRKKKPGVAQGQRQGVQVKGDSKVPEWLVERENAGEKRKKKEKAVYTTASVACGWAGAVM